MPLVDTLRIDQRFAGKVPTSRPPAQQVLFKRARALPPKDQLLLQLTFRNNLSVRQIGKILERPAGTVSRNVQRLCARLRDPLVATLIESGPRMSAADRAIAMEFFAQGRRIREIARDRRITRAQIKEILHFIRGWYRGVRAREEVDSPREVDSG